MINTGENKRIFKKQLNVKELITARKRKGVERG
jgi:hypothetical protein